MFHKYADVWNRFSVLNDFQAIHSRMQQRVKLILRELKVLAWTIFMP